MPIKIDPLELLALKKLAVICGALGKQLSDQRARAEQLALTSVLVDVCNRAELENATPPPPAASEPQRRDEWTRKCRRR